MKEDFEAYNAAVAEKFYLFADKLCKGYRRLRQLCEKYSFHLAIAALLVFLLSFLDKGRVGFVLMLTGWAILLLSFVKGNNVKQTSRQ